eukprot:1540665-Amphidinium_carterae.1
MEQGKVFIRPTSQPHGADFPVIPNHFTAMLDPQVQWWEGCDFPIDSDTQLVETWRSIERLVESQSNEYPEAVRNSNMEHYNMREIRIWLQIGLNDRIRKMYAHVNYGRGIPIVISSSTLTRSTVALLGTRVKEMESTEWTKHNMLELQQLLDKSLLDKLQEHVEFTAKLLGKVEEDEKVASGLRAGASESPQVPAVVPNIVHQTEQHVAITIQPGPMWKTTEFDDSDVWLVGDDDSMTPVKPKDNMIELTPVPPLNLRENTWTPTKRVTGVVKPNPMKTGASGLRAGASEFYVDYLQVEGIASRTSIRYPTRDWFKDHFILTEHHGFTEVELQALVVEGVDLDKGKLTSVPGMWILNSFTTKISATDERIARHVKLLEV